MWGNIDWPALPTRDQPTTQACALTGNRTSDPAALRLMLNLLSHTSQGNVFVFFFNKRKFI